MKSTLNLIWHWGGAERLARFGMGSLLALALTACASASQPVVTGPKVQTFYELMVKLKKGFDEGTLDTPEFYARELGYPLERPETLKVIAPPYTPSRQINFDSGELRGAVAQVGPLMGNDGRKAVSFRASNVAHRSQGEPCIQLGEVQKVWGVVNPQPEAWGAHGALPILHYLYRSNSGGKERTARFVVDKQSGCIQAGPTVGQYYE